MTNILDLTIARRSTAIRAVIWYLLVLTLVPLGLPGCTSATRVGHPVWGVTRRFPVPAVGRDAKASPYDFERLKNRKGLYIFSYEITFQGPSRLTPVTSEGLRVWEQDIDPPWFARPDGVPVQLNPEQFPVTLLGMVPVCRGNEKLYIELPSDKDSVVLSGSLYREAVKGNSSSALFPNYGAELDDLIGIFSGHGGPVFEMRFMSGGIVYGGHVAVNGVKREITFQVTDLFETDMGPIIKRFEDQLEGITINTDLMNLFVPDVAVSRRPDQVDRPTREGLIQ